MKNIFILDQLLTASAEGQILQDCGEVSPDGDDLSRVGPDVPAAVDVRRVFKGPARAGYHSTGRPYLLRYISTGWRRPQKHKG